MSYYKYLRTIKNNLKSYSYTKKEIETQSSYLQLEKLELLILQTCFPFWSLNRYCLQLVCSDILANLVQMLSFSWNSLFIKSLLGSQLYFVKISLTTYVNGMLETCIHRIPCNIYFEVSALNCITLVVAEPQFS